MDLAGAWLLAVDTEDGSLTNGGVKFLEYDRLCNSMYRL